MAKSYCRHVIFLVSNEVIRIEVIVTIVLKAIVFVKSYSGGRITANTSNYNTVTTSNCVIYGGEILRYITKLADYW